MRLKKSPFILVVSQVHYLAYHQPYLSFRRTIRNLNMVIILSIFMCAFVFPLQAREDQEAAPSAQKWRKKPGLSLRFGSYIPQVNTKVRIDSERLGQGTEIDFEDLLQLDRSPVILRGDAEIPVVSWFSLDLGFYAINRNSTKVIDRDIQMGDTIFNLNQTVNTKFNTTYLRVNFKFFIIRKPRLDLGLWAGANVAFFNFSLQAQELGKTFSEGNDVWAPIPSIGIHGAYTLFPNFFIFGKAGYFYYGISDNLKFNALSYDINVNYYFYKFLGIGATYEYNRAELDGQIGDMTGLVINKLGGFQFYLVIGF